MNPAAILAAAAAAAASLTAYAGLSDESQIFGPVLVSPPLPQQFALTFDDGPNPAATPRLLELLARHNARATFFLIGEYVVQQPALTREIHAAGHTIGNHTMHHPWLARHPATLIRREMEACSRAIEDTVGTGVTLFRPPHGARRPAVLRIARELGMQTVQWNLMVGDWKQRSAEDLFARISRGVLANRRRGRGTNLVLHDGGQHSPAADRSASVEAAALILENLPAETIFVTPPDWSALPWLHPG